MLIAEDDVVSREMLAGVLARWGYETVLATDGEQALRIMQGPDAPRLAILDWMMPGLDGVSICRRLRDEEVGTQSPAYLILLTSRDSKDDVIRGLEAGANDYLVKPYNPQELRARVAIGWRMIGLQGQLVEQLHELQRAERRLAEAWARELQLAGHIQQSLLVGYASGDCDGATFSALSIPSRQVDGDFFDVFAWGAEGLDLVVGDVMGKGIQAAMLAAAAKGHVLRALTGMLRSNRGALPRPREVVGSLQAALCPELMAIESFLTLCYVRVDVRNQRLVCVDCGHTGLLHRSAEGRRWRTVHGTNTPIGFLPGEKCEETVVPVAPGDLIVLFSDGVTEAARPDGERFGEQRLMEVIDGCADSGPRTVVDAIRQAVVAFAAPDGFGDDVTCLVVRTATPQDQRCLARRELALTSEPCRLAEMREALAAFLALAVVPRLGERERDLLMLAVQEAAANVILHAYRGESGRPLDVQFEAFPESLRVTLCHQGDAFVPTVHGALDQEGPREGGCGLRMIAAAVDSCRYDRDESGRNRIVLDKRVRSQEAVP